MTAMKNESTVQEQFTIRVFCEKCVEGEYYSLGIVDKETHLKTVHECDSCGDRRPFKRLYPAVYPT